MGKFTSAIKGVMKSVTKKATKVGKNATKLVNKGTAKSNITKALKKKNNIVSANNDKAASNISAKTAQTTTQKNQLNATIDKGKSQIAADAKDTSSKVNQSANLDKAQAMKENFVSQSNSMKEQHKLNVLQQKLDNKTAAQANKNRLAIEKQQNKHEQKMQKEQDKLDTAKKNAQQKLDTTAANKQAALNRKTEAQNQKHQLKMEMKKQTAQTTMSNQKKYADATMTGLTPYQKWQYNRAQKKQMNMDIRKVQAGIDPKTGRILKPTILPNGQVVGAGQTVLPNGQVVGTGHTIVNVPAATQSATGTVGNALNTALQIGMTTQMLGGIFGNKNDDAGQSEAPSGVPEQSPTTETPSTSSPSHIPPGGVNINVIHANKNNAWLGSQIGSNSSSNSTQADLGINSLLPNKKPSPTNTEGTKEPSPTGPISSGWLV